MIAAYTEIHSPYDGVITARNYFRGDFIQSAADQGQTLPILAVARTDKLRVVVMVPDRDVPFVDRGDPAYVHVDALPGREFEAVVSRYSESEDPGDRTMHTEVDLDNSDAKLQVGMYGGVRLVLQQPESEALTLPASSLIERDGKGNGAVYVVRDGKINQVDDPRRPGQRREGRGPPGPDRRRRGRRPLQRQPLRGPRRPDRAVHRGPDRRSRRDSGDRRAFFSTRRDGSPAPGAGKTCLAGRPARAPGGRPGLLRQGGRPCPRVESDSDPSAEALEDALDAQHDRAVPLPANTISARIAEIRAARLAQVESRPSSAAEPDARKPSTLIGLSAVPLPGSPVQPPVVGAANGLGRALPFHAGSPSLPFRHPAGARLRHGQPAGAVDDPGHGTRRGRARRVVSNYLPGDLNGDGVVNFADLDAFHDGLPGDHRTTPTTTPRPTPTATATSARATPSSCSGTSRRWARSIPLQVQLGLAPGQYELGSPAQEQRRHHPGAQRHGRRQDHARLDRLRRLRPGRLHLHRPGRLRRRERLTSRSTSSSNPEDRLKNTEYLIFDPYGQQTIAAFPILLDR